MAFLIKGKTTHFDVGK
ncbi:hypothetical protein OZH62_07340 [Escherichia coli]|nr:hypothetical protein [Escherichia coli]MCK2609059.1 hypothetical protein [Escherichia coli]MCZ0200727.1 hypothetical protein [Escherichia coli]MCZ0266789.1 hypothetical protein [Escherichia coli]MCZ0271262.1 hypothetical protein [Escherichia coli]MCZ0280407.1 hypothetical protein [Escherichia coli]